MERGNLALRGPWENKSYFLDHLPVFSLESQTVSLSENSKAGVTP